MGGEYTSSLVFLAEHEPPDRRTRNVMWGLWSAVAGILQGSGVGAVVAQFVEPEQLSAWRLPTMPPSY